MCRGGGSPRNYFVIKSLILKYWVRIFSGKAINQKTKNKTKNQVSDRIPKATLKISGGGGEVGREEGRWVVKCLYSMVFA